VARYAAGKGKLFEQPPHPVRVLRDVGIDFAVGAFQLSVRHQPGSAVARPGDVDHVQNPVPDDAIQVGVDKIESRSGAPVTEQARFDVRQLERLLQERIVVEINLSDREIVRSAPPRMQLAQQFRSQSDRLDRPRAEAFIAEAKEEFNANILSTPKREASHARNEESLQPSSQLNVARLRSL